MLIGRQENRIVIRAQDMIVAEHAAAQRAGDTVADAAHIEAMWKLSLKHTPTPPPPWQLTFSQQAETTPLSAYQEAIG